MTKVPETPARRSVAGILFSGAVCVFFFVVGAALVIEGPVAIYRQEVSWHWPLARGQIISVSHSFRGGTSVHYVYYVGGHEYEARTGDLPHLRRAQMNTDNQIMVRYDPANPRISILDPGFPLGRVFEILFGVFLWMWSVIMGAVCVSSYRDPANNKWSFGWKKKGQFHTQI